MTSQEEQLKSYVAMKDSVHDLLVNYKRERMMEHKIQNTVLQSDLAILLKDKEETEGNVNLLQKEIDKLEVGCVNYIKTHYIFFRTIIFFNLFFYICKK